MKLKIRTKISTDLKECKINLKLALAFIPIAFLTYLFHEFGHWLFGELCSNRMTLSLNNAAPTSGHFTDGSAALWSAIGGPLFTILQALIFWLILSFTKSVYAYAFMFFAVFSRFFSIVFGGLHLQDEARIASMLDLNKYLPAALVLFLLFLILWRCHRIMKFGLKALGYYVILGVVSVLIVIGVNELI